MTMRARDRITSLFEGVVIAIDALRANKVRAALTILGIAIGVFVVVLMSAVIHGINSSVAQEFEKAGPTTFFVYRFPIAFEGCTDDEETCKWRRNPPLRVAEAAALERLSTIQDVTIRSGTGAPVKYRDRMLSSANVNAYTANWIAVTGGDIVQGRNFTPAEATNGARVAVINETMAERLFNGIDPLGKELLLNSRREGCDIGRGNDTDFGQRFHRCDFYFGNSAKQIVVAEDRLQVLRLITRISRKREVGHGLLS